MDETAYSSIYMLDGIAASRWPALTREKRVVVAIIGGGFTGLSTALHLAESGIEVAVLEAHQPGWGASGRNGGQLNPGLKYNPSQIIEMFGPEVGGRLIAFAWSSVQQTAQLIERLGIDCDLRLNGTLRAAARAADAEGVRASQKDMACHGMPVEWLDADQIERLTGHAHYYGGFIDRRGGDLNPLRFCYGLARAANAAGAAIYGDSRALSLDRNGGRWHIITAGGSLVADKVLICCNGYADGLVPALKRAMVPVFSSVLATPPLPGPLADRMIPERQVLYESGLVTVYYRIDKQNRLILGGRGPMRPISSAQQLRPIANHALHLWPDLAGLGWKTAWNGRVSVTTDHMPHVHELGEGLMAIYGYNGRGVALAVAMGQALASCFSGQSEPRDMPLPLSPLNTIRLQPFWPLGVHATIAWSRIKASLLN